MIINEVNLRGGAIQSRQSINSDVLSAPVFKECEKLLGILRTGLIRADSTIIGPTISVGFGLPSFAASMADRISQRTRFVVIAAEEYEVFTVSLVLGVSPDKVDDLDCSTLFTLSESHGVVDALPPIDQRIQSIKDLRPCVVHTILPTSTSNPIKQAAVTGFASCFATAILLGY